jgi:hypothetical protein
MRKKESDAARKKERKSIRLNIGVRKQTPEEERQFQAALRLFLMEMVRQELHALGGENHAEKRRFTGQAVHQSGAMQH